MLLKGDHQRPNIEKRDRIITIDDENVAGVNLKNEDVLKKLKGASVWSNCLFLS